jgi:EAL domain-containing protein (putative c-di-GMP-specific phosphodiesterase class I)
MAFQPIVDTKSSGVFAYQALVRGEAGGSAGEILAQVTAERRYAFDQSCRVRAIELAVAGGILQTQALLSINFLPNAVYSPLACIQLTLEAATRSRLPHERLIFEFTENEEIGAPEHVRSIIECYKQIGFKVAIDDFGAGHSGLDMFAQFAPDEIKLDMALIRGINADKRRQAIVRAVVSLCAELDTLLIAEGVESSDEARALIDLGVRYHQGYFYARPAVEALPLL